MIRYLRNCIIILSHFLRRCDFVCRKECSVKNDPLWTKCPHIAAGTCPILATEGSALYGKGGPRPELSQDHALVRLAEACGTCALAPKEQE